MKFIGCLYYTSETVVQTLFRDQDLIPIIPERVFKLHLKNAPVRSLLISTAKQMWKSKMNERNSIKYITNIKSLLRCSQFYICMI